MEMTLSSMLVVVMSKSSGTVPARTPEFESNVAWIKAQGEPDTGLPGG